MIDPRAESPYAVEPGAKRPANVIFECVGLPGVLDGVTRGAPHGARVMVAGWCLETDRIFTPTEVDDIDRYPPPATTPV